MFNLQLYLCWLLWVQMLLYNMSELYLYIHSPITHHTSVLRMQPYTPSRKGADMKPRCISDWYPLQTEEAMNIFNIHLEGRWEKRIHHSIFKKKVSSERYVVLYPFKSWFFKRFHCPQRKTFSFSVITAASHIVLPWQ